VENPDLADCFNTVKKMAKKRALVDAVQTNTACSDLFVQDLEDGEPASPIRREEETRTYPPAGTPAQSSPTTQTEAPSPQHQPPPQHGPNNGTGGSMRYELFFERPGPTPEQKERLKACGYRYDSNKYCWRGPDTESADNLYRRALNTDNVDSGTSRDIVAAHAGVDQGPPEEEAPPPEPPSIEWATQEFMSSPKIDFLKACRDVKDLIHSADYYDVLAQWKMEHANWVHPQDVVTMNVVIEALHKAKEKGRRV